MRKHLAFLLVCALVFLPSRVFSIEEIEGGNIRGSRLIDNSVPPEKLKSQTSRAGHLFYRGDGTWASVYGTIANFSIEPVKLSAPEFFGTGARFYRDDGRWADVGLENGVTLPITGAMLDNATLQWQNFPSDMRPVLIVANVASETCGGTKYPLGAVLYSKSDYKLYRCLADNTWTKAVPTTDLTGTLTDNQIASLNAAKLTGTITATNISDNVITTPMLKTGFLLAGNMIADNTLTSNLIADNAIIAGKLAAGSVYSSSVLADNVITNNMLVGGINAAKISTTTLSSFTANLGAITAGTITSADYAEPTGSTAGSGLKINASSGTISAYGGEQNFGGTMVSTNGTVLVSIGKYLTETGKTQHYPANTVANYTADGAVHIYEWSGSAWSPVAEMGRNNSSAETLIINGATTDTYAAKIYHPSALGTGLYVNAPGDGATGIISTGDGYGGKFSCSENSDGGKSPVVVGASTVAGAPNWIALKGSLWVDSNGILYINKNGNTTWEKVGSQ